MNFARGGGPWSSVDVEDGLAGIDVVLSQLSTERPRRGLPVVRSFVAEMLRYL